MSRYFCILARDYRFIFIDFKMLMLSFLLRSHNYEIFEAYNGHEGLAKAKELKPDVILLDIQMPDMNGFEVCTNLKQENEMKKIPVILFTSYSMNYGLH